VTGPYPNRFDSFGTRLVDGGGFFGYTFADLLPYIPSGTAYLGQANAGLFDDGIVFTFPSDMLRVGAYVVADPWQTAGGPVHVTAYNASGDVVDSLSFSRAAVTGWRDHFIGFEDATGIRSILFKGEGDAVLRLDDLTFEPVPEPSTFVLLGMGAVGLLGFAWRWRRGRGWCLACAAAVAALLIAGSAQADVFNMGGTRNPDGSWTGRNRSHPGKQ